MDPQNPPADKPPTPPASEPVTPPNEPTSACALPIGDNATEAEQTPSEPIQEPGLSMQRDDTPVVNSVSPVDSPESAETTNTESTHKAECMDVVVAADVVIATPNDTPAVSQPETTPHSHPPSSPETSKENSEVVEPKDDDEPATAPEPPKLLLPEWFLESNVALSEDLQSTHPPLGLLNPAESIASGDPNKITSDAIAVAVDYEVHQSIYEEAQDLVFSGIQPANGSNPPSDTWAETAAFLLQSPKKGTLDFLDTVVRRLARDFGADLVSVNREDLEDVCQDIWSHNTKGEVFSGKYLPTPHRFIRKFFARYDSHPDEARKTVKTIVDASETKRAAKETDAASIAKTEARRPIILLLRDVEVYDQTTPFSQFYQVVKTKRREGKLILILATAVSNSTDETKLRTYAMDKVWDGLCLDSSKVVNISPRCTKRSSEAIQKAIDEIKPLERWRQLRRALRRTLGPEIAGASLSPTTEWPISGNVGLRQAIDDWDDAMTVRFIRQICTRARRTSTLEMSDITEVLERMSQNKAIFTRSNNDETASDDGEDDIGSKRRLLLEKISAQCSDDEKSLFDCIIDTDSLTATGRNIRVDSEIKESLEQLLKLRVQKSYGLLAQESVNGAVLYGPPGTGKTHLARVVAKTVGTNLIVATPADLQSCWVGETEKRIKALFSLGFKLAPSLIFLDEGDSLFTRRRAGDQDWTRKAMSQFLMEMDGLCKHDQPPFLLVATNRPADMDEAICRRLPHMLHMGMPSSEDRRAILDIYLREEQVGDVDLDAIAATATKGFSGSDIRTLCVQAAMAAQREIDLVNRESSEGAEGEATKRTITTSHFKTALNRTRPSVTRESLLEIQKFASQQRKPR